MMDFTSRIISGLEAGGWRLEAGMWDCDIAVACVEKTQSE